ncbi:carboxy terminal-processing peptidase, partial [Desulfobulbus sp. F4]|nr:carboxy terminal-processing peptidase [Desulfobulbus sp. F4]
MRLHRFLLSGVLVSLLIGASVYSKVMPTEFDAGRNRLIAYMLSRQLPAQHFSHKELDAQTSKAAYDLYLKQIDPRKQFLLAEDAHQLDVFADKIGEEISQGRILLPDAGMELLNRRAEQVGKMVDELLKKGFDFERADYLQIDPEKIAFSANAEELRDRWRRILKLDVIESYLEEIEKENKKREEGKKPLLKPEDSHVDQQLWVAAVEKVRKKTRSYIERIQKTDRQEHYNRYFDVIARAFDPHTSYMAPESKEDFDIHMSGSLEGIGALLREDDGHIKVVNIIAGSPAEIQGQLQAEDIILAVSEKNGEPVDISAMSIREAVSHIRGPKGTEVRLTVSRADGSRVVIPIIRDVVKLEETYVKSAVLKDKQGKKVGVLKIPGFYRNFENKDGRNVTDDTRSELHKLKKEGIAGLILDLRGNGGGSLSDAVEVSGLFLPGGPVVQVKNSEGKVIVLEDEDKNVAYNGPLLVLVNQFAASASEILAAALQDYGRALIVGGAHTHGKGTVQALVDMNRNLPLLHLKKYDSLGALKVTIQKFYRISGSSTQYKGVTPDVVVPSMLDYLETGEQYLDYSMPWDKVESARHTSWSGLHLDSALAKQKSETYLASSEKFKKIQAESLRAKERKEKSLVPVYLAGVLKERQELARAKKEAEAAGVLGEDEEDEEHPVGKKEKKTLAQELAQDPYADLALFLMDSSATVAE